MNLRYDELKKELSNQSLSKLPALFIHIVQICSQKPVFTDKAAMLRVAGRAWDSGIVEDVTKEIDAGHNCNEH